MNRSAALSALRKQATSVSAGHNGLSADDLEDLFHSPVFADSLFVLFSDSVGIDKGEGDENGKEHMLAEDVVNLAKYNFRGNESCKLQELFRLFESCIHLATPSSGQLERKSFARAVGGQGLSTCIRKYLLESDNGDAPSSTADLVAVDDLIRFLSNMTASSSRSHISKADLQRYAKVFRKCAKSDNEMSRDQFAKMVSSKNKFFVDRCFHIFNSSGSGKVSLDEYNECLGQLAGNNNEGAIKFLFDVYDVNGDGRLVEAELREALRASMEENGMIFDGRELDDLAHALWEDAGKNP